MSVFDEIESGIKTLEGVEDERVKEFVRKMKVLFGGSEEGKVELDMSPIAETSGSKGLIPVPIWDDKTGPCPHGILGVCGPCYVAILPQLGREPPGGIAVIDYE